MIRSRENSKLVYRQNVNTQVKLRPLKRSDLQHINRILDNPQVYKFFNFQPPLSLSKTLDWFEEVKKKRKEGECFVAVADKVPIGWCYGFLNARIKKKILLFLSPHIRGIKRANLGYLAAIVVDPRHAKERIGEKLLKKWQNYLRRRGAKGIWLGVNSDNVAAKKLYEKFNFKLIGSINNFKKRKDGSIVNQDIYIKLMVEP